MKRRTRNKTNSECIIDALRSGEHLRSPEIREKVWELCGREMKIQDIASMLSKLSNSENCDLGFLIEKKKSHRGFSYKLCPEALELDPEKLYDLSRKTGKDRYTLEQALDDYPELQRQVDSLRHKSGSMYYLKNEDPAECFSSESTDISRIDAYGLVARIVKEVLLQPELNFNVNLNINFTGISGK